MNRILPALICFMMTLVLVSCGSKKIDTNDPEALVKGFYEAMSEGDAELLKQTRHIKFISLKTLRQFENDNLFDKDGRRDYFSNVKLTSEPKLFESESSDFKYKLFDYKLRIGLKFESQKAYHKFLGNIYPRLQEDPDIEDLKAEGWVRGVSIKQKFKGMTFWDDESQQWYFCEFSRHDIYRLKQIISDREYRALMRTL
ncbi:MAG: hypothetical protein AAFX87_17470 [Bacteroidota bacterium]